MQGTLDGREFRRVLGHYPTGVCAITSLSDSVPVGMIVGSFTSVSLDPALVAFLPDRKSRTWAKIEAAGHFCVNILAARQQDICLALSSQAENKFSAIPYRPTSSGLPIIEGVVAWIDCKLDAVHEAGDHVIAIGRVRALDIEQPAAPLIFLRGAYGSITAGPSANPGRMSAA
jgi:3-hydroxy-9,10-secoandrosta-1,3,5(10)-triene-9,17-dione monooxygenase reductase component